MAEDTRRRGLAATAQFLNAPIHSARGLLRHRTCTLAGTKLDIATPFYSAPQFLAWLDGRAACLLLERFRGNIPEGRHKALPFDLIVRRSA